jgi:hypothetical protein
MLLILSICDDGWALGYRLGERADEWTGTATYGPIPHAWLNPGSMIKAFPLVCATLSWAWKGCVDEDMKVTSKRSVNGARSFAPATKRLNVCVWLEDSA